MTAARRPGRRLPAGPTGQRQCTTPSAALDSALATEGTSLAEVWPGFAAWNLATGPRTVGTLPADYGYLEAVAYAGVVATGEGASIFRARLARAGMDRGSPSSQSTGTGAPSPSASRGAPAHARRSSIVTRPF